MSRVRSQVTVHARVLKNEQQTDSGLRFRTRALTVEVLKDFSLMAGKAPDTLVFWTAAEGAGCGVDFPEGLEAILFGDTTGFEQALGMERPAGAYRTSLCSGNVGNSGVPEAVAQLEAANPFRTMRSSARSRATPARQWFGRDFYSWTATGPMAAAYRRT
jgi:hypothetical protein